MSRKELPENIDQLIIATTLKECAHNPANRFSTRKIAKECGISEFAIFERFRTKRNLIAAVGDAVSQPFYVKVLESSKNCPHFFDFFTMMVDYLLSHPDDNAFALNYCPVFPRIEKAVDDEAYRKRTEQALQGLLVFFQHFEDKQAYFIWTRFNRELLVDCQLIIDKKIVDTPANRLVLSNLIFHGLQDYLKA